ncbi:type III-B CRISPR-associated protein Cas10/Cmr2 [Oscillatoriales cyanobacterium USR001]|nr:type III-B CRISPR-associated protein Cas10/Cmr2 [Oscillatoriales cyanobacterium USR001]
MNSSSNVIKIAIAWCLGWGEGREPQFDLSVLQQMHQALNDGKSVPEEVQWIVKQVKQLQEIPEKYCPENIENLKSDYAELWKQNTQIGLVYGGATKIKQYVFENTNLTDIRGASALLDRINLVDLPAFFGQGQKSVTISQWLSKNFPDLATALIPELIIYSTGGNILAFCPAAFVDELANAIEKRYTEETLRANSCAVGDQFNLLEIRFGLLADRIEDTFWLNKYRLVNDETDKAKIELVRAYFGNPKNDAELLEAFQNRKSFNEITTKLAILFNQRRSGNDFLNRPSRRYPPMFETHPYLRRDESDLCSAIAQINLPSKPYLSESLVRKRIVGQIAKREVFQENLPPWFTSLELDWQPTGIKIKSWVAEFEDYLAQQENCHLANQYYENYSQPEEARSLRELGNVYQEFVAYIYADGNNMGGYIQTIKTPEEYKQFSEDIFEATENSVYQALAEHLHPHKLQNLTDPDNENRNGQWIHPFEILTIGGDDVMLIVPANKALQIAKTIGEEFERKLAKTKRYPLPADAQNNSVHRCQGSPVPNNSSLSMSIGVLVTAKDMPVYYAEKLTEQLLKSAKKRAKKLRDVGYYGGTVDFLTLKSVTMISSNIEQFRKEALTKKVGSTLQLYAAPYTFHELGGLIKVVEALKNAEFPKSQLYQIRSLLEKGKRIAILNYRYFRARLKDGKSELLQRDFEEPWCPAKTNEGNIAPWMYEPKDGIYETIWREVVDIYDFIEVSSSDSTNQQQITAKEARK